MRNISFNITLHYITLHYISENAPLKVLTFAIEESFQNILMYNSIKTIFLCFHVQITLRLFRKSRQTLAYDCIYLTLRLCIGYTLYTDAHHLRQ